MLPSQHHLAHHLRSFTAADATLAAVFAAVVALFAISPMLLERFGYHYAVPGGFPWEKLHPGTIFVMMALGLRIAFANSRAQMASRIFGRDPLILLYLAAVVVAAFHAALVSGNPVTILVDTWVLPALLVLLLDGIRPDVRRGIALTICALMAINAVIAMLEYLTGWHLTPLNFSEAPIDPSQMGSGEPEVQIAFQGWRATALLGHPLENAIVVGAFCLCLASRETRWLPPFIRFPLLGLSLASLVAFGGRVSMVFTILGVVALGLLALARRLASGGIDLRRGMGLVMLGLPLLGGVGLAVAATGFFDRTAARFSEDSGSTNARLVIWDMFTPLSWSDLLLGPDPAVVQITQRLLGIELGIENFWAALVLTYGLIVACGLFAALGLLCWRLVTIGGAAAATMLVFFVTVASTSTSLSSKTTALGLVTLMILVFPREDSVLAEGSGDGRAGNLGRRRGREAVGRSREDA